MLSDHSWPPGSAQCRRYVLVSDTFPSAASRPEPGILRIASRDITLFCCMAERAVESSRLQAARLRGPAPGSYNRVRRRSGR